MNQDDTLQTAGERAYQFIQNKILSGDFKPGEKLSLRKVASQIGISTIPVIEALKKLDQDLLVEYKPKHSAIVAKPTLETVLYLQELRLGLEVEVARILAAKGIKQDFIENLKKLADHLDTSPNYENGTKQSEDAAFHIMLAEATGNPLLYKDLKRINLYWILSNAITSYPEERVYPRYWHRLLLDTILTGNVEQTDKTMREHIASSVSYIERRIKNKDADN